MTAILLGILSLVGLGIGTGIISPASKKLGGLKSLFLRSFITVGVSLIAFLAFFDQSTFSLKYMFIAFLVGTIGYIGVSSFFQGLSIGKIGIVAPVSNSSSVITILLVFLFFGQTISKFQIFSVILIILGVILITVNPKELKLRNLIDTSSGIQFALLAMVFWGITFAFIKVPVDKIGPFLTPLIIEITNIFWSAIHLIAKKDFKFSKNISRANIGAIVFGSLFSALGFLFYNIGVKSYNVSIIAALSAANPLVAVIYGAIVHKEKLSIKEYLGILLSGVGIILISI